MNPAANLTIPDTWLASGNEPFDLQTQQTTFTQFSPISPLSFEGGWLTDSPLESSSFDEPFNNFEAYDYEVPGSVGLAHDPQAQSVEAYRREDNGIFETTEAAGASPSSGASVQESRRDEPHRQGRATRISVACVSCREARIKCTPNPNAGSSEESVRCMRCTRTGQDCVYRSRRGIPPVRRIISLQKQVKHMEEMSRLLDESLSNQSSSRFRPLPPNLSYRYPTD